MYKWREEAEEARRRLGEGALSREDLVRFVDRYMPAYKAYLPQLYAAPSPNGPKGPVCVFFFFLSLAHVFPICHKPFFLYINRNRFFTTGSRGGGAHAALLDR